MKVFSHLFDTLVLSRIEYTQQLYGHVEASLYLIKSDIMLYVSFLD